MSRLERLNEAVNQMLNGSICGANEYLLAALYCGLILKDVRLETIPPLNGNLAIFVKTLCERDQMLDRGDAPGIQDLKAEIRAVMEGGNGRLLSMITKGMRFN